ncbi:MAG: hypothetical protein HYZ81_00565 [Nitrospinae bacterium]|nr:hypothetical protein [Nitrospinota bacterium]
MSACRLPTGSCWLHFRWVLGPLLAVHLAMSGCAQHVTIRPPLNTSLGYQVYEALGEVNRAPVHVGLLIEQPLQELTFSYQGSLGTVVAPIGQVLAAKIVHLVSLRFDRVTLIKSPDEAPPLLLRIALQGESPDIGIELKVHPNFLTGASTFDVIAKTDVRLRASLSDYGEQLWVGTARFVQEMASGGVAYGATEGSTQASDLMNRLTDQVIADLAQQIQRSSHLKAYLEGKRI